MNDDEGNRKVIQNIKPLFSINKNKKHYIALGDADMYDILMTMNDNLTRFHSNNDYCILSLLNSKPKCIFNTDTCDCDQCIQRWMKSIG